MIKQPPEMQLRDYFAAQAIPIAYKHHKEWLILDCDHEYLVWNGVGSDDSQVNLEMIAEKCYQLANAMMKARVSEDLDD
jgi:uncharacterized protein YdaT